MLDRAGNPLSNSIKLKEFSLNIVLWSMMPTCLYNFKIIKTSSIKNYILKVSQFRQNCRFKSFSHHCNWKKNHSQNCNWNSSSANQKIPQLDSTLRSHQNEARSEWKKNWTTFHCSNIFLFAASSMLPSRISV